MAVIRAATPTLCRYLCRRAAPMSRVPRLACRDSRSVEGREGRVPPSRTASRTAFTCDNFLYEELQGRADARQRMSRRGFDKGTLAATQIGLVRAGQRPPDRRTAYGPPPLVKPPAPFAQKWPEAGSTDAMNDDHQDDGLCRE